MIPPPTGISVIFEFNEVPTDGTFCYQCGGLMTPTMHQLYASVSGGDPLDFEMIPTKYKFCEACKMKSDDK